MDDAVRPVLEVRGTARSMSEAAAESIAGAIRAAVAAQGCCSIALAGGRTPRDTYVQLAERHAEAVPWSSVHVFWGDERCVPPADPESNFRMADDALLRHVRVPPQNIHRIPGELPPEVATEAYERDLRAFFRQRVPAPTFDLVLLGVGADGHTASLFPGSPALEDTGRWALAVEAPEGVPCRHRVTLALPAINASRSAVFLIAGADKSAALRDLLRDPEKAAATPAGRVCPQGELQVFADAAAAGERLDVERP